MVGQIRRAFSYWFRAILKPAAVFDAFRADPDRLQVSLWILLLFSIFYTFTALILYLSGMTPAIAPWLPVNPEKYYLYQTFWTIPWGLATGIMMAGIAHVMALLRRDNTAGYSFRDALAVISIAWVIPSFVLMWLPETFLVPFLHGVPWPDWLEILRLAVLAPIWQVGLVAVGIRKTHQVTWRRAVIIGLVVTGVGFAMFLPIMR